MERVSDNYSARSRKIYSFVARINNPRYNIGVHSIDDIFGIWVSLEAMALDLVQLEDTVYRWKKRGRIPEDMWPTVIEKAAKHERLVTAQQLMKFNASIAKRGRPRQIVVNQ